MFYGDVVIKPWSACRATHPSIDAVMQIVGAHDIDPEEVAHVTVHATPRTAQGFVGQPFEMGEDPQVSGAFSIIYTAAVAIAYRCRAPRVHEPRGHGGPCLATAHRKDRDRAFASAGRVPNGRSPT